MKKKILLLTMLLLFCFAGTAFAAADVTVKVDGKELPQKGVIVDGRTMVPIRDIAEAVGFDVIFDNSLGNNRVELQKEGRKVGQVVGNSYTVVKLKPLGNGQYEPDYQIYESDVPAQNINGKMMMPLKVAAEIADVNTSWDGVNRIASVTSKQSAVSDDGKIDLMPTLLKLKGVEQQPLIEKGFEIKELTAEKDESKNGWWIRCKFDNVSGRSLSAAVYLLVYDKQTGKLIEAGPRDYDDDWAVDGGWITAQIFHKYDPKLHDVDVDIS